MPGSRADQRIARPDDGSEGDLTYKLADEAFQAGVCPRRLAIPGRTSRWPRWSFPAAPLIAASGQAPDSMTAPASARPLSTMQQHRRPAAAATSRQRVPVQTTPTTLLRGTSLTRPAAAPSTPAFVPLPQEAPAFAPLRRSAPGPSGACATGRGCTSILA